jgi:hypothetical protein
MMERRESVPQKAVSAIINIQSSSDSVALMKVLMYGIPPVLFEHDMCVPAFLCEAEKIIE